MSPGAALQLALIINFVTLVVLALWKVVPWTRSRPISHAVMPLVTIHTARTVALNLFAAQEAGYPISDGVRDQIVWGDQVGTVLALLTLLALWRRPTLAKPLVWLLVIATVVDLSIALFNGIANDLLAAATNLNWMILAFYIPMLWVSILLVAWLLVTRRHEEWVA